VFAYNHSEAHVASVLAWAARYTNPAPGASVATAISFALAQPGKPYQWDAAGPDAYDCSSLVYAAHAAARVILFAATQLGKPYAWGATGPDAFDCSGLTMRAYRSAGIAIPRTSQEQWAAGPYVPPGQEQPGDLVFFPGSDGTAQAPRHVGIVLGGGLMIDAPYTGAPVRVDVIAGEVGFTRPAAGG
jgi:peptidoglycan DL-endopeptidase CwlO